MKVRLLSPDHDYVLDEKLAPEREAIVADLALDLLFATMAAGDQRLYLIARDVTLASLGEVAAIEYRQRALADCLAEPAVVVELYELAVAVLDVERRLLGSLWRSPTSIVHRSVQGLDLFIDALRRVCALRAAAAARLRSEAFVNLFATLQVELDDAFFGEVAVHLKNLRFRGGVLVSAELGPGNRGEHVVLRAPRSRGWRERLPTLGRSSYSFAIAPRDEAGARALDDIRNLGVGDAAEALEQSCEHMRSFFRQLRDELGFYIGAMNLHAALVARGIPICYPEVRPAGEATLVSRDLRDIALTLTTRDAVVGNDLDAEGRQLVVITGANQGGKSTFLRSVGVAQLMAQCGMFVGAGAFMTDLRASVFTHFRREEDATMESGKLDEELARMSATIGSMTGRSLLLCNESFASTNEREGSEIARQIVYALLRAGVKVLYVTHMYDLAEGFHNDRSVEALFMRAPPVGNGNTPFKLVESGPQPTSHGEDVYERIFGERP